MKTWKKELLKEWWNDNLDYLPLGSRYRGLWQKRNVTNIIKKLDDRKLDIEIAQKVFGYEINVGTRTEYEEYGGQTEYPELEYVKEVHKNGSYDGKSDWKEWEALPHYSTDIKDAFLIVDKIKMEIAISPIDSGYLYCAQLTSDTWKHTQTIPLAICNMALNDA